MQGDPMDDAAVERLRSGGLGSWRVDSNEEMERTEQRQKPHPPPASSGRDSQRLRKCDARDGGCAATTFTAACPGIERERKKPDMNDNTRDLKASEIASHAVQAAGQAAYDSLYQRTYWETYEGLRELTLCL